MLLLHSDCSETFLSSPYSSQHKLDEGIFIIIMNIVLGNDIENRYYCFKLKPHDFIYELAIKDITLLYYIQLNCSKKNHS